MKLTNVISKTALVAMLLIGASPTIDAKTVPVPNKDEYYENRGGVLYFDTDQDGTYESKIRTNVIPSMNDWVRRGYYATAKDDRYGTTVHYSRQNVSSNFKAATIMIGGDLSSLSVGSYRILQGYYDQNAMTAPRHGLKGKYFMYIDVGLLVTNEKWISPYADPMYQSALKALLTGPFGEKLGGDMYKYVFNKYWTITNANVKGTSKGKRIEETKRFSNYNITFVSTNGANTYFYFSLAK